MTERSKNSGIPKRFFKKKSMAGSLARHIGQQALPALVHVLLDHACVALDRGPMKRIHRGSPPDR